MTEQGGNHVPMTRREARRLETGKFPQVLPGPADPEQAEPEQAEEPALADTAVVAEPAPALEAPAVEAPAVEAPAVEASAAEPFGSAPQWSGPAPEPERPEAEQPAAQESAPEQPEPEAEQPEPEAEQPAAQESAPEQPEPTAEATPAPRRAGFVRSAPVVPPRGWRGFIYRLTGGAVNLGPNAEQRYEQELAEQIGRRLDGSWNTAFLSLKGGIGKTSTTVGVGLTLAELRPDPPCAIDANPDAGDLVERALGDGAYESERQHSITALLRDCDSVSSRSELGAYLHQAGGLHLLAGEQDPELSDSLTADEYRRVHRLVSRYFGVTLTDCGTGVTHPAMQGILQDADSIVVVAGYAVSGAKRARDTLHWLAAHGYERLAKSAVVVVTDKDGVSGRVDKETIEDTLAGLCKALITVPHDKSMADGDLVSLATLRPDTRNAYREIAAAIVSSYER
ncbi:MinD/ParA family ATP-binding protein [Sinomonas mesophila]|uniref:MinD/ParA family ATP-binding protein n=1 Tax=Sinomonas mesophila TaxID=1531955 RepID=UPI001FEB5612|nr:MinD/ParA family protein [Sinomonas mesophila]